MCQYKTPVCINALAVINGNVEMILECRNLDENLMLQYIEDVERFCNLLKGIEITRTVTKSPVICDERIMDSIEMICQEKGISYIRMPSGATHDASIFGLKVPVGMIFIPSHEGISHNKEEWSKWEDCNLGSEVLYEYVRTKI